MQWVLQQSAQQRQLRQLSKKTESREVNKKSNITKTTITRTRTITKQQNKIAQNYIKLASIIALIWDLCCFPAYPFFSPIYTYIYIVCAYTYICLLVCIYALCVIPAALQLPEPVF